MANQWLMKSLGISELIGNTQAMASRVAGGGAVGVSKLMGAYIGKGGSISNNYGEMARGLGANLGKWSAMGKIAAQRNGATGFRNYFGAGGNYANSAMRYGAVGALGYGAYRYNNRRRY